MVQATSKLIVTCSTFALYASSFAKEARQGLACAESPETDLARAKRWDTLGKFETHFNHWCVSRRAQAGRCSPPAPRFKVHLNCVQFYASSENVSLLPLVVRLNSIKVPT